MRQLLKTMMVAMTVGIAAVNAQTAVPAAKAMSLAEARGRIGAAIAAPAEITKIVRALPPADQCQFVAALNKAIGEMPASGEEKAAKFLNANRAAIKGAAKGNVGALIAEVYATVPMEALTVINERFAADLLNRNADASGTVTDEQFVKIAEGLMAKVNERCDETDNSAPRAAMAIVMLVRASGGSPANLADTLVDTMKHADAKEMARTEWIPAALGRGGRQPSYDPILASADAGRVPDHDFTLSIAGPQFVDVALLDILGDLSAGRADLAVDAVLNGVNYQIPRMEDFNDRPDIVPQPDEAKPYAGQTLH